MGTLADNLTVDCGTGTASITAATAEQQAASDAAALAAQQAEADAIRQQQDRATARGKVVSIIQSAVGITWPNLTATQKQALVVAALYKFGALDGNLTVQPLGQWL